MLPPVRNRPNIITPAYGYADPLKIPLKMRQPQPLNPVRIADRMNIGSVGITSSSTRIPPWKHNIAVPATGRHRDVRYNPDTYELVR